jgi:hypothetical protein
MRYKIKFSILKYSKPIVGINYIVSLRNKDPKFYVIPDPLLSYFTPYFANIKIVPSTPLLSRR